MSSDETMSTTETETETESSLESERLSDDVSTESDEESALSDAADEGEEGEEVEVGGRNKVLDALMTRLRSVPESAPEFNEQLRSFYTDTVRYGMKQWYVSIFFGLMWPLISLLVSGGLGAAEIYTGAVYFEESCDANLYKWLLIVGLVHMVGVWIAFTRLFVFLTGYAMIRQPNRDSRRMLRRVGLYLDLFHLFHAAILMGVYIYGIVLVVSADRDDCPNTLFQSALVFVCIAILRFAYWIPLFALFCMPIIAIASLCCCEKLVLLTPKLINVAFNLTRFLCCCFCIPKPCYPRFFDRRDRFPKLNLSWTGCCLFARPDLRALFIEYVFDNALLYVSEEREIEVRRAFGHLLGETTPIEGDDD